MKSIVYKGTYICSIDVEDNKKIDKDTAWTLFWEEFGSCSIYPKDFDDITFEVIEDDLPSSPKG